MAFFEYQIEYAELLNEMGLDSFLETYSHE